MVSKVPKKRGVLGNSEGNSTSSSANSSFTHTVQLVSHHKDDEELARIKDHVTTIKDIQSMRKKEGYYLSGAWGVMSTYFFSTADAMLLYTTDNFFVHSKNLLSKDVRSCWNSDNCASSMASNRCRDSASLPSSQLLFPTAADDFKEKTS